MACGRREEEGEGGREGGRIQIVKQEPIKVMGKTKIVGF